MGEKQRLYTSEGYETVWLTNHVGPVYLTTLLQDMIAKSDDDRINFDVDKIKIL